jgi:hypothetical protein
VLGRSLASTCPIKADWQLSQRNKPAAVGPTSGPASPKRTTRAAKPGSGRGPGPKGAPSGALSLPPTAHAVMARSSAHQADFLEVNSVGSIFEGHPGSGAGLAPRPQAPPIPAAALAPCCQGTVVPAGAGLCTNRQLLNYRAPAAVLGQEGSMLGSLRKSGAKDPKNSKSVSTCGIGFV